MLDSLLQNVITYEESHIQSYVTSETECNEYDLQHFNKGTPTEIVAPFGIEIRQHCSKDIYVPVKTLFPSHQTNFPPKYSQGKKLASSEMSQHDLIDIDQ